jgi:hypothetical protein
MDIPWVSLTWECLYKNGTPPHERQHVGSFWWRDIMCNGLCSDCVGSTRGWWAEAVRARDSGTGVTLSCRRRRARSGGEEGRGAQERLISISSWFSHKRIVFLYRPIPNNPQLTNQILTIPEMQQTNSNPNPFSLAWTSTIGPAHHNIMSLAQNFFKIVSCKAHRGDTVAF